MSNDNVPHLLIAQQKKVLAIDNMLDGLKQEYLHCLVQGRLDKWIAAARAMIDFIEANDGTGLERERRPKPTAQAQPRSD